MTSGNWIRRTALAVVASIALPAVAHGQAPDGGASDGNGSVSSDALVADVLTGEAAQRPQSQQSPAATLPSANVGDSAKQPPRPSAEVTASGASAIGSVAPTAQPLYETVVTASAREETIFQSPRSRDVAEGMCAGGALVDTCAYNSRPPATPEFNKIYNYVGLREYRRGCSNLARSCDATNLPVRHYNENEFAM